MIYQSHDEYDLLHEDQRYRHMRYEPPETDYLFEREWRIHTDGLELDPAAVTLVVPTRAWEERLKDAHQQRVIGLSMALDSVGPIVAGKLEWHFLVLEDLGVIAEWPEPETEMNSE